MPSESREVYEYISARLAARVKSNTLQLLRSNRLLHPRLFPLHGVVYSNLEAHLLR